MVTERTVSHQTISAAGSKNAASTASGDAVMTIECSKVSGRRDMVVMGPRRAFDGIG
jgi:hypothetical protein